MQIVRNINNIFWYNEIEACVYWWGDQRTGLSPIDVEKIYQVSRRVSANILPGCFGFAIPERRCL
jgi:hypothetical protein